MATSSRRRTLSRSRTKGAAPDKKFIDFKWEGQSYLLDLKGQRVYRNWMAVEANKGFTILGAYRSGRALTA